MICCGVISIGGSWISMCDSGGLSTEMAVEEGAFLRHTTDSMTPVSSDARINRTHGISYTVSQSSRTCW